MTEAAAAALPATGPMPARALAARYRSVRAATERLRAPLSAEDCAVQSMPDASPTKWHLAHTTWFFETFVLEPKGGERPFDPSYRFLFNSYYNAVGPQHVRAERGLLSRPGLDEVLRYRAFVDERMLAWLEGGQADRSPLLSAVLVGLHHEQQHQELILTDVKHALGSSPLRPAYRALAEAPRGAAAPLRFERFEEGVREIGHTGAGFAFDNEGPRHRALVPAFELASRCATNAEYLAFMEDGGYERPELWLSDGFAWQRAEGVRAPLYWERDGGGGWRTFTLGGLRPLRPEEPVTHVSYYEAAAFAEWAGARLPGEEEWEVAAGGAEIAGNFVESDLLHPAPAPAGPGLVQLFGDVWEWTRSDYGPYPGYRPPPGALGEYNGKFMCNQRVLRGGSCATPASHIRASYRNFFPPPARWQLSGIRLARDVA